MKDFIFQAIGTVILAVVAFMAGYCVKTVLDIDNRPAARPSDWR